MNMSFQSRLLELRRLAGMTQIKLEERILEAIFPDARERVTQILSSKILSLWERGYRKEPKSVHYPIVSALDQIFGTGDELLHLYKDGPLRDKDIKKEEFETEENNSFHVVNSRLFIMIAKNLPADIAERKITPTLYGVEAFFRITGVTPTDDRICLLIKIALTE